MTLSGAPSPPRPSLPVRLAIAASVLLAEYLGLSYSFDAQVVQERGGVWTLVGRVGSLGPLLVVAAAALLLLAPRTRLPREPNRTGSSKDQANQAEPHRAALGPAGVFPIRPGQLLLHGILAAVFFGVTSKLFGQAAAPAGPLVLWLIGWVMAGVGSAGTLFVGMVGDSRWVMRAFLRALAVGGILGVLAFAGGLFSSALWESLSSATFHTVSMMLDALGFDLQTDFDHRVLGLQGFHIAVAPVCSGVEGLGLFTVLMSGFLIQFRNTLRFPRALLLLPLGMGMIWLGNAARIATLMIIGARVDQQIAIGSFHSKAGWVVFCALTIAVAKVAHSSRFFSKVEPQKHQESSPAAPWIVPVLCWIAIGLATSSFTTGHDPLYGLRVVVCAAVLWHYRSTYRLLLERPSPVSLLLGALVGGIWLLIPTSAAATVPGEGWSDLTYFSWLWLRPLGAIVIVPIVEELAFRGYLARWLTKRPFWAVRFGDISWLALILSSVAFGLLHDRWLLASGTGIVYATILKSSRRMSDAVAAHAASNTVIAAYVLATQSWQHW